MRWEEVPDHEPAPDEVVVDVIACGLNHSDLDSRAGTSRWPFTWPWVLGAEFAGHVTELGAAVEGVELGAPVTAHQQYACGRCPECARWRQDLCRSFTVYGTDCWGGYAERVRVPARALIPLRSDDEILPAAASQCVVSTAWSMVRSVARVQAGETVLVPSGSGGVAGALIQCARVVGARVISTVGSADKQDRVRALGAEAVFSYRDADVRATVMELTGGRGVDAVLDTVGGELFGHHLACLRPDGRLATCGAHAGEVVSLDVIELFRHGHRILGFRVQTPTEIEEALRLVLDGTVRVPVAAEFGLDEAGAAHAAMDRREHVGKMVLVRP
jgi:NADPH:quinone reductase-like Zn-dependent oxidoreductase